MTASKKTAAKSAAKPAAKRTIKARASNGWAAAQAKAKDTVANPTVRNVALAGGVVIGFGVAVGLAEAIAAKTYALMS